MKLFLRDQLSWIVLYSAQTILLLSLFWLGGYRNTWIYAYALFLSLFVLACALGYRYVKLRSFYHLLSHPLETLDASIQSQSHAPVAEALDELLASQYHEYKTQLHQYERKIYDHVTFINQWVHQMKTPLAVMQLQIQDEDGPVFTSIREEMDRIGKGLETVLYTARLDRFEKDFVVERVCLQQMVNRVLHDNRRLFIRNRVYPDVQIDPALTVESDEKWLSFLIGQLVVNAVRYSAGKGQKVTIASEVLASGAVMLEVRDQGIGIPTQDIPRVFDPYFTGENGRIVRESTGMGLYLVREVCGRLGHRVELETEVGVGTTVRLLFTASVPNLTSV